MILKKNFSGRKVLTYVKIEFAVVLVSSTLALSLNSLGFGFAKLPLSIATILGSALAIFIAFRNNSSYSRWWEARTLWGSVLNASRVYTRLVITFTDSHKNSDNYSKKASENFKKEMVNLLLAWVILLKIQLRDQTDLSYTKKYLSDTDYKNLELSENKLSRILLMIGSKLYGAMNTGILAGFDSFQIENQLLVLQNSQGSLERIKNTPLLRQYHYFTKLFMLVFIILLPFSLIGDFEKLGYTYLVMPISMIIGLVYAIIAKVGEVNEDPFENRITDVPMDYITNKIERDALEAIAETKLPPVVKPKNGYIS